jgi:ornithine cyclodeaminase/alanine dehydrogenase-like protein (mu-crystallin family)
MLVLSHSDLVGLLPPLALVAAVEQAARDLYSGRAIVPKRGHLDWAGNTLLTMPAICASGFGVKMVAVVPGNASRGLPVTSGLMILNDGETGAPVAILDAGSLTAQRTGAVGGLGVKFMTPMNISSMGIIGCGVQGAWQVIVACALRPIREVFCVYRSRESFAKFSETVGRYAPEVALVPCADARDLLTRTDLVITATTAATPVLPDEPALLKGKHFISVGSFKPSMQELPDSVYSLAGQLAVDSEHARHEVGDVINPCKQGLLRDEDVFSIGECVVGSRSVDTTLTTAYKSVGMAIYDLCVAQALHRAALARGSGRELSL